MGTRCNVLVTDSSGENKVWLYRHWDGYPSHTGADLARVLRLALTEGPMKSGGCYAPELAAFVLKEGEQYEETPFRKASSAYEYTSGEHGDIEYLYAIRVREPHNVAPEYEITVQSRRWSTGGKRIERVATYNLDTFEAWLNEGAK